MAEVLDAKVEMRAVALAHPFVQTRRYRSLPWQQKAALDIPVEQEEPVDSAGFLEKAVLVLRRHLRDCMGRDR